MDNKSRKSFAYELNENKAADTRSWQQTISDAVKRYVKTDILSDVMGHKSSEANACNKPDIKEAEFARRHFLIAVEIGITGDLHSSTNISTSAARFANRSDLDRKANKDGMGTEVNALRHAIWQSIITARYGSEIAKEAGDAHEINPRANTGISDLQSARFNSLEEADQSTDLKNNEIGREIGISNPNISFKELALHALEYFHTKGLWMAFKEQDGTYRINQTMLPDDKYQKALVSIKPLTDIGMTSIEELLLYNRYSQIHPY